MAMGILLSENISFQLSFSPRTISELLVNLRGFRSIKNVFISQLTFQILTSSKQSLNPISPYTRLFFPLSFVFFSFRQSTSNRRHFPDSGPSFFANIYVRSSETTTTRSNMPSSTSETLWSKPWTLSYRAKYITSQIFSAHEQWTFTRTNFTCDFLG